MDRWVCTDLGFEYTVNYHKDVDSNFTSLPTFDANFNSAENTLTDVNILAFILAMAMFSAVNIPSLFKKSNSCFQPLVLMLL